MRHIEVHRSMVTLTTRRHRLQMPASDNTIAVEYGRIKHHLDAYIRFLYQSDIQIHLVIYGRKLKRLKRRLKTMYIRSYSAGGIVKNEQDEILFICQNNEHLDLPKGGVKKGEKPREAALREVNEETGAVDLTIIRKSHKTWKIKKDAHGALTLNTCIWYEMVAPRQELTPQTAEGIISARWIKREACIQQQRKRSLNTELWLRQAASPLIPVKDLKLPLDVTPDSPTELLTPFLSYEKAINYSPTTSILLLKALP